MEWQRFVIWNSLGGIAWVLTHVMLGYYVGTMAGVGRGLEIVLGAKIALFLLVSSVVIVRRLRSKS